MGLLGNWVNEWQRVVDRAHPLTKEMVLVVCHKDMLRDCLKFDHWIKENHDEAF